MTDTTAHPALFPSPGPADTVAIGHTREGGHFPHGPLGGDFNPTGEPEVDKFIAGTPAAQGSKRAFIHPHTHRPVVVEQSKRVKPWRADVRDALTTHDDRPIHRFDGAVCVALVFVLHRPGRLPKKRATPPHETRPDGDKLARALFDAVTSAGVWRDDAKVTTYTVHKRYAELGEPTGCYLRIWSHP